MKGKVDLSTEPERYALKSRDVGEDFPDQKPKKKKKIAWEQVHEMGSL